MGQYLKMSITVPDEYLEGFVKADNTFLYQLVFDPINRKVTPLNPYPAGIDPATLGYAGLYPFLPKTLLLHCTGSLDSFAAKQILRDLYL